MKKIMMTLAAVCVAATMNAQMYVGGGIGFNNNKSNNGNTTATSFSINPEFGMALNDQLGWGVQLGFETTKNENKVGNETVESTTTKFSVKPYLRYQAFEVGKVNVFVDGGVNFGISSQKDMKPAMDLGLFVTPGIAYNVNDKWSIVAKLNNMFAFGYHKDAVADVDNAPEAPTSINANLSTGGFQLGSLTFGVYYNF